MFSVTAATVISGYPIWWICTGLGHKHILVLGKSVVNPPKVISGDERSR